MNNTKQIFFAILLFTVSIFLSNAQTLKELNVETTTESATRFFNKICRPDNGVLVFKTNVIGLTFELNMTDKLIKYDYYSEEKEYVLCVEPTDRRYWVIITHPEFTVKNYLVEDIRANQPQYFKIESTTAGQEENRKGREAMSDGKFTDAEENFRNAIKLEPQNPNYHRNLANALRSQGKNEEAISALKEAIKISPDNAEYHNLLGNMYDAQKCETAINHLKKALDLQPNNEKYLNDHQRVLDACTDPSEGYIKQGDDLLKQRYYSRALEYYKDALRHKPEDAGLKRKVEDTEILVQQDEFMKQAQKSYERAQSIERPKWSANKATRNNYVNNYKDAVDKAEFAKKMGNGNLPDHMQKDAETYKKEYKHARTIITTRYAVWCVGAGIIVGGLVIYGATRK